MTLKTLCIFLSTLLVSACATAPPIPLVKPDDNDQVLQRQLLVGTWYGEKPTEDGGLRQQVTRRAADGTFRVDFRWSGGTQSAGEQSEVGYWGISGPVYFTITRGWIDGDAFEPADPTDASLNDAYEVLELEAGQFRYRSLQTGTEYQVQRVRDGFEFPPPVAAQP